MRPTTSTTRYRPEPSSIGHIQIPAGIGKHSRNAGEEGGMQHFAVPFPCAEVDGRMERNLVWTPTTTEGV